MDVKILAGGSCQDPIKIEDEIKRAPGAYRDPHDPYNNEPVVPKNMDWRSKPKDPKVHVRNLKDKMNVLSKARKKKRKRSPQQSGEDQ